MYTDRQTRREVWDDENLVPFSTAATIALEATGADPYLVTMWRDHCDLAGDPNDWITYARYLEGELQISLESQHGTLMSPTDWAQHYDWPVKLWKEMSKYTTEHYNEDGVSATELDMIARRKAQTTETPPFDPKGRTLVRIPGDVIAIIEVDGFDTTVEKIVFSPHASNAGYFGPHAEFWDFPEGITQEQVEAHLRIQDVDGRFWRAVQAHLPTHDVKWEE